MLAVGDAQALAAAGDRIGAWSADGVDGLLAAAVPLGRFVGEHKEAAAVSASGRRLLALAKAAGADPSRVHADPDLRRLQD